MLFYNVFAFLRMCINGWLGINIHFNSISGLWKGEHELCAVERCSTKVRKPNLASNGFRILEPCLKLGTLKS